MVQWVSRRAGREFCFNAADGRQYALPYARIDITEVYKSGTFSGYDSITVTYVNGDQRSFQCVGAEIHLKRFKRKQQVHKTRNVSKPKVGIANKF